jgi:hypothetical protein
MMAMRHRKGCRGIGMEDGQRARIGGRERAGALLLAACLALIACGGGGAARGRGPYPLYLSPNGEPLSGGPLGRPSCGEAMTKWFHGLDGGTGRVTLADYLADARRQFAAMDLDHDGFITSAELQEYRAPYRAAASSPEERSAGEEGNAQRPPRTQQPRAAVRGDLFADRSDPVMSADRQLRFKVDLADFLDHAERSFKKLDRAGSGALSLDDVLTLCESRS